MRSRQTGQVGNSIRAGVGGAGGLELREVEERGLFCKFVVGAGVGVAFFVTEGVNGSLVMSGNEACWPGASCVRNSTDFKKTTWQFSGFENTMVSIDQQQGPRMRAYLHAIERLAIPLSSPFPGLLAIAKFHEHHVPVPLLRPNHPEMADLIPGFLAHKAEEVGGREVRRHSQNAQRRAVFISKRNLAIFALA